MTRNEGTLDRAVRILGGLGLMTWAVAFNGPVWAWVGVLPIITGALGSCPAYTIFGISTCSMKK